MYPGVMGDASKRVGRLARGIRRCRSCRLWETRSRAAPGEGDAAARCMLVGEAPGEREDLDGRPFTGRAGRHLDAIFADLGLSRSDFFITASVKCRPPNNRDPRMDELTTCRERWLEDQIAAVDPELIVAMGRIAAVSLLGAREPLRELRGQAFERKERLVVVTPHPAASMRFPEQERAFRQDFWRIGREMGYLE